jgi:carbonic anhydrase
MKLNKVMIATAMFGSVLFANSNATHWGYTGHEGPANWGDLQPKYIECKLGGSQSPINISQEIVVKTNDLKPIDFEYKTAASEIVNNGHSIQVNVHPGSFIKIDNKEFELKQFHFHTPSENQIEGKNFPLEAHFVHVAKDGAIAVVAVLYEDGKSNSVISKIWKKMPRIAYNRIKCALSPAMINQLLPKNKEYYRFDGSLTTPPCTEGVRWFVLKEYPSISKEEVAEFLHTMHHPNNRPVQPVNARKVLN